MRLQWGAVHFESAATSLAPLRSVCSFHFIVIHVNQAVKNRCAY